MYVCASRDEREEGGGGGGQRVSRGTVGKREWDGREVVGGEKDEKW